MWYFRFGGRHLGFSIPIQSITFWYNPIMFGMPEKLENMLENIRNSVYLSLENVFTVFFVFLTLWRHNKVPEVVLGSFRVWICSLHCGWWCQTKPFENRTVVHKITDYNDDCTCTSISKYILAAIFDFGLPVLSIMVPDIASKLWLTQKTWGN
jgi:hypothetical protein